MADNNQIFILFEELKSEMDGIKHGIATLLNRLEDAIQGIAQSEKQQALKSGLEDKEGIPEIKGQLEEAVNRHTARTKAMLEKYATAQVNSLNRIAAYLRDFSAGLQQIHNIVGKKEVQEHIHRHSFDFRSSKVFSLVVGMGIVCCVSLWGNVEQWKTTRKYTDDALKFRFIRSNKGCTAKDILWLNEVFDIHRNEGIINEVRKRAERYDVSVKAVADSIMQTDMKRNTNPKSR